MNSYRSHSIKKSDLNSELKEAVLTEINRVRADPFSNVSTLNDILQNKIVTDKNFDNIDGYVSILI